MARSRCFRHVGINSQGRIADSPVMELRPAKPAPPHNSLDSNVDAQCGAAPVVPTRAATPGRDSSSQEDHPRAPSARSGLLSSSEAGTQGAQGRAQSEAGQRRIPRQVGYPQASHGGVRRSSPDARAGRLAHRLGPSRGLLPYHGTSRPARWFGIQFEGEFYHYRVLPFGWNLSMYFVNKLLAILTRHWRAAHGLNVWSHVDDFVCATSSEADAHQARVQTRHDLEETGVCVEVSKDQGPAQTAKVYGFQINAAASCPSTTSRNSSTSYS